MRGSVVVAVLVLVASLALAQPGPLVSIKALDAPLTEVLGDIARQSGLAIVFEAEALQGRAVTLELDEVYAESALRLVCQSAGCGLVHEADTWVVTAHPSGPDPIGAAKEKVGRGDFESARAILGELLGREPDKVEALLLLADVNCRADDRAAAHEQLARLRGLGLTDAGVLARIGVLDGRLKVAAEDRPRALAAFDDALATDPDCLQAYFERAKLYELQGEREKADADWRSYLERDPEGPTAQAIRLGCVVLSNEKLTNGRGVTWSADGGLIAYSGVGRGEDSYAVRTIDVETREVEVIAPGGEGDFRWCLDWSPDGQHIAWEARKKDPNTGERGIFLEVYEVATGEVQEIRRPYALYYPCWHPDSKEILVFTLDCPHNLETVPFGIEAPRLRFEPHLGPTYCYAGWSPDGKWIVSAWNRVVGENYALYLIDVENPDAPHVQLTQHDRTVRIRARYAPDGRVIGYLRAFEPFMYALYAMAPDGSSEELPLTTVTDYGDAIWGCDWAPDGRRIVYSTRANEVRVLTLGGLTTG